tara:strand:- start:428 stop:1297 length:870 start_codon:yes stop_codon:yes gene_type:complete
MLEEFLSRVREVVSLNMKKCIGATNPIEKAMSYSALTESKMIRAGLIMASGKINKHISNQSLVTLSTSIELMHTYSLIHDDLPSMDDDDYRRGKKSCHIEYGEANAILAGDALQTLSYEIICNDKHLSASEKIACIKLITNACGKRGMVYGQFLDIESESKKIDVNAMENIHSLKTGKLIECAVMLGQIGNLNEKETSALKSFGKKIGLAFQITDDILEITSDKKTLGKSTDSDLKNKKSTYATVVGIEAALKKSNNLSESAISDLELLDLKNIDLLIELAKYISYREK